MIEILIGIICITLILVWGFSKNKIKPVYRRIIGAVAILLPIGLYASVFFIITHNPLIVFPQKDGVKKNGTVANGEEPCKKQSPYKQRLLANKKPFRQPVSKKRFAWSMVL
jgi:hypothetical protein